MTTGVEDDDPAEQGKWGDRDVPRESIREMQREWEQGKQTERHEHDRPEARSERRNVR